MMSTKSTWLIEGEHTMHCAGCVQTVEYALSRISGVEHVTANHITQKIEVLVTDPAIKEDVISELRELAYEVKEVDNDSTA